MSSGKFLFAFVVLASVACSASSGTTSGHTTPPPPTPTCTMGSPCDGPLSNDYTCTGDAQPTDKFPTLSCSAPSAGSNGTMTYCCKTTAVLCVADPAYTACGALDPAANWAAYACNGAMLPTYDGPDPQVCWAMPGPGQDAGSATEYCCTDGPPSGCYPDASVTCNAGTVPYNCKVSENLQNITSSFNCSTGNVPVCCSTDPARERPCTLTQSLQCSSTTTAYSCAGIDTPEPSSSTTIACDAGTIADDASQTTYCCFDFTSSTCTVSHSVVGCSAGGLYGFSCQGSSRPEQSDSSLSCSVGFANASSGTDYCCTRR